MESETKKFFRRDNGKPVFITLTRAEVEDAPIKWWYKMAEEERTSYPPDRVIIAYVRVDDTYITETDIVGIEPPEAMYQGD